jgi:hypothetical protein
MNMPKREPASTDLQEPDMERIEIAMARLPLVTCANTAEHKLGELAENKRLEFIGKIQELADRVKDDIRKIFDEVNGKTD